MPLTLSCPVDQFNVETSECAAPVWVDQSVLLPPLPAAQGLELSGLMIGIVATAWAFRAVRLFISPKTG